MKFEGVLEQEPLTDRETMDAAVHVRNNRPCRGGYEYEHSAIDDAMRSVVVASIHVSPRGPQRRRASGIAD